MEKELLRVAMVQSKLHWENPSQNLLHFDALLTTVQAVDLVLLPEMFTTGFSMNLDAADGDGSTLHWMKKKSREMGFAIAGSVMTKDNGSYYNRFYLVEPDGSFHFYDKRHLFRMAQEDKYYTPGQDRLIIRYLGWRICPMICYDLRFPVWSRNQSTDSTNKNIVYDLLLYVANWPQRRETAWKALLPARAIENYAYCIGVNRVGEDGNNIPYSGYSMAIDPLGSILAETNPGEESILLVTLSLDSLKKFRTQFPSWKDADSFSISK
jgi:predicted amidohydrolase